MKNSEKEALERAHKLAGESEPAEDIKTIQKRTLDEANALKKMLKPARFVDGKRSTASTVKKKAL